MAPHSEPTAKGMPAAQALPLAALVSYQEGSVVSRTILKREAGNVTLFAFDEGQGLSEHTAPYDALVYLVEGEAEVVIGGETIQAKAGDAVLMPAYKPHALKARTRFKMLLAMIRFQT